jgi:lipopolysaccharide transport system permease protein
VKLVHVWGLLGWQDVRQRYRRSVIGVLAHHQHRDLVATMGCALCQDLNQDLSSTSVPGRRLDRLGTISSLVSEACTIFISNENLIKQVSLPSQPTFAGWFGAIC